jgi:hypothetical protein
LIKIKLWIDGVPGSSYDTNSSCLHNIYAQFAATGDNNVDLMDTFSESSQSDNDKEEPFYERIDIIMISLFPFKLGYFHANGKHIIKSVRTLLRKVAIFVSSTRKYNNIII